MSEDGVLEVVTYNIHGCLGVDRRLDVDRVGRVLAEIRPDVVALQEVHRNGGADDGYQAARLASSIGLRAVEGPIRSHGDGHYGNAILTRLPLLAIRRIDLTVRGCEPRGALDLDLGWSGSEVRVISTHLGLNVWERHHQAERLLSAIEERRPALTILLGDFNTWFQSSRLARLLDERLGPGAAPAAFPSWWPIFSPDRIWVFPRMALLGSRVHASPAARVGSDHLPVRARVALTPREG